MIRLEFPQGSAAWIAARLGIPTASMYSKIITQKTMKLSESSTGYRDVLLAEWLLGEPMDTGDFTFTERGTRLETQARAFYEMQRDVEVDEVGFLLTDDRRTGGSPDGLVGDDGMVEIKVPSAPVHVGYLLDGGGDKYRAQMQGNLWISGREWIDFLSYNPLLPPALVRYRRDEPFIKALSGAVSEFCDRLAAAREEFLSRDIKPLPPKMSYQEERKLYVGVG